MITWSKAVRVLSQALLILGIVLLSMFVFAHIHRLLGSGADRAIFESSRVLPESDFSAGFGTGTGEAVTLAGESTVSSPQVWIPLIWISALPDTQMCGRTYCHPRWVLPAAKRNWTTIAFRNSTNASI